MLDFVYRDFLFNYFNIKSDSKVGFVPLKGQEDVRGIKYFIMVSHMAPEVIFYNRKNKKNLVFVELDTKNYLYSYMQLVLLSKKHLSGTYTDADFLLIKECQSLYVCISRLFGSHGVLGDWSDFNKEKIAPLFKRIFNDQYLLHFISKNLQFYKSKLQYNDVNLEKYKKYELLSQISKLEIKDLFFFIPSVEDFVLRMEVVASSGGFDSRYLSIDLNDGGRMNIRSVLFDCNKFVNNIRVKSKTVEKKDKVGVDFTKLLSL